MATPPGPVQRIEAAGRLADARARDTERLRRLPDDVAAALVGTGLLRAWVPSRYGGGGAEAVPVLDGIERLAFHDGATGWCAMIGATTSLTSAFLPERWAAAVFGDPGAAACGVVRPGGTAVPVEGGIRVTGRWSWGSGAHHATWFGGGVTVEGAGSPFVLFARDQVELLDTWHTVGLRGTGSGDVRVTDAVVPDGRWVHLDRAVPVVATPVSGLPFLGLLAAGVASVALGLARRARHELVTRPAGHRSPTERPAVAAEVARAEAAERAARAFLHGAVDGAADGSLSTDEAGRRLRLAATHATWAAAGAVDRMYHAAGGSAVHEDAPIQRVFRDVHVATQHAMVSDRTFELLGQGSPPGPEGGR